MCSWYFPQNTAYKKKIQYLSNLNNKEVSYKELDIILAGDSTST